MARQATLLELFRGKQKARGAVAKNATSGRNVQEKTVSNRRQVTLGGKQNRSRFVENPREYIVVSDDDDEEQLQKASTSKSQRTPGSSKDSTTKRGAVSRSDKEEPCQVQKHEPPLKRKRETLEQQTMGFRQRLDHEIKIAEERLTQELDISKRRMRQELKIFDKMVEFEKEKFKL